MPKRLSISFDTKRSKAGYIGTWEQNRDLTYTKGLEATPEQRIAWLEAAIRLAYATGALARRRQSA